MAIALLLGSIRASRRMAISQQLIHGTGTDRASLHQATGASRRRRRSGRPEVRQPARGFGIAVDGRRQDRVRHDPGRPVRPLGPHVDREVGPRMALAQQTPPPAPAAAAATPSAHPCRCRQKPRPAGNRPPFRRPRAAPRRLNGGEAATAGNWARGWQSCTWSRSPVTPN